MEKKVTKWCLDKILMEEYFTPADLTKAAIDFSKKY